MGLRKLWELVGHGTIAEGSRNRSLLERHGIRVVQEEILSIDPAARAAETIRRAARGRPSRDRARRGLPARSRAGARRARERRLGLRRRARGCRGARPLRGRPPADPDRRRPVPVSSCPVRVRLPPRRAPAIARPARPHRARRRHTAADADAERGLGRLGVDGRSARRARHLAAHRCEGRARRGRARRARRRWRGAVRPADRGAAAPAADSRRPTAG